MVPRDSILKTEVEWLASIKADLVVIKCCFCCFLLVGSLNNSDIRIKIELKEVGTMFILSFSDSLLQLYKNRSQMLFQLRAEQQLMLEFALSVSQTLGNY